MTGAKMVRAAARVALLGCVALAAAGGPALAARLPDWAEPIAGSAPPLPDAILEHDSRVLLQETSIVVRADGTFEIARHTATQALTPKAGEIGIGFFPFDEDTQKLKSRGWHVSPEGKTKKSRRDAEMDLTLDDIFLTDAMTRIVHVPDVERGSLVFFQFEAQEVPKHLHYQELFLAATPTDVIRVRVEAPDGWEVRHRWLRVDGPAPSVESNAYTWEMRDLAAPEADDHAPPFGERAPLLQIAFVPPAGAEVPGESFDDWTALARWYEGLAAGRDEPDDAIRAAAARVLESAGDDRFERIEALATWVRDSVRYVAKSVGIGGYQPHPASEVLANLYGDCKDKATLLSALLATDGVDAHPVLVRLQGRNTVAPDLPIVLAFDHLIVAVPIPPDAAVPPRFASAILDAPELGRLLIVDVTDERNAVGSISASLAGKRALVVDGDRSALVDLPGDRAADHGVERDLRAALREDGSAELVLRESSWGEPARRRRSLHTRSVRDFETDQRERLAELWAGAQVTALEIVPEDGTGRFVQEARIELPPAASASSADTLPVFPAATRDLPEVTVSSQRETPVEFPHPMTLRATSRIEGLPAGAPRPEDYSRGDDGWHVESTHALDGDVLEASMELRVERRSFSADELRGLRRLWSASRRASGSLVPRGGS